MSFPICLVPLYSEICESWYWSTSQGSRAHSTLTTCTNLCCAISVNKNHSESLMCTLWRGVRQGEKGSRHARVVCNTLMGCIPQIQPISYIIPQPQNHASTRISIFLLNYNISFSRTLGINGQKPVPLCSKDSTNLFYHNWSRKSIRIHLIRWEWRGENYN